MSATTWPMRIESGLAAHFKQADGLSRPGVSWLIGLQYDGGLYHVRVKALLADGASSATCKDEKYQAETAMQYVADELRKGWHPSHERDHEIHIGDPLDAPLAAPKPWWKLW